MSIWTASLIWHVWLDHTIDLVCLSKQCHWFDILGLTWSVCLNNLTNLTWSSLSIQLICLTCLPVHLHIKLIAIPSDNQYWYTLIIPYLIHTIPFFHSISSSTTLSSIISSSFLLKCTDISNGTVSQEHAIWYTHIPLVIPLVYRQWCDVCQSHPVVQHRSLTITDTYAVSYQDVFLTSIHCLCLMYVDIDNTDMANVQNT